MTGDEKTMLARIDERMLSMQVTIVRLEKEFVSLTRYLPVERLVYGLVTIALAAVTTAMITLVIRK